jgi:serine/threonine protein kinase
MPLVLSGAVDLYLAQSRHQYNTLQDAFPQLGGAGVDLLNDLLAYDPTLRLTARGALRHQYFRSSPFPRDVDFMPTFPTLHDDMMAQEQQQQQYGQQKGFSDGKAQSKNAVGVR